MIKKIPFTFKLIINLLYCKLTSKFLIRIIEKKASSFLDFSKKNKFFNNSSRITTEKKLMIKAIINSLESSIKNKTVSKSIAQSSLSLWAEALKDKSKVKKEIIDFYEKYGQNPPWFLVISPGHSCNLKCKDCYAASGHSGAKLDWDILDTLISQAKKFWDIKLIVFSGGEPFAYRSKNKDILDIASKYPDLLFLAFTNGTLIDDKIAKRIAECKNFTPAISVEGLEKTTDERRGRGVFNKVLEAMQLLRKEGVPFGISITASSSNLSEILSDDFLDYFFKDMGVFYGFYFQYLPIGRNADFSSMPSASQRKYFFEEMWAIIKKKKIFILDFWNHGTLVRGCISAGREGGYFYIDWNGKVMPCVFTPFPAADINELFKNSKTINDFYEEPFFAQIRSWQKINGHGSSISLKEGNLLTPCPYRDHYSQFEKWIKKYNLNIPENTDAYLSDFKKDYSKKMCDYDKELAELFDPLWEKEYFEK